MFDTRDNRVPNPSSQGRLLSGGRSAFPHAVALYDVLVVSANHPLRSFWARNLRRLGIAISVSEATSLHDARGRLATGGPPDLILLDADLAVTPSAVAVPSATAPGDTPDPESIRTGCAAALGVLRRQRLVVIGVVPDPGTVRTILESGARGYLFGGGSDDGPDVVRPRRLTATVVDTRGSARELSVREVEVLQHAADGRSNIEIGLALHLSPLTVKSHLGRIGRRLGSGDRAHLVLLALRSGVLR